jgi:glycosyltransferase involved in cell wall biosynthesis
VSTNAGGIGEVIENQKSGYLVEIDDYDNLSTIIAKLQDKEKREKIGKAARERVVEKFSMKRMVDQLEEIYVSHSSNHKK